MATEPTLALQKAFVTALKTGGLTDVYDRVPDKAALPYIVVGDDQFLPDKADGLYGGEIASNIHVYYAKNLGRAGVKAIAQQVSDAIDQAEHDMGADYAAHVTVHTGTTFQDEEDGKTTHAIVGFSTFFDTARDAA